MQLYAQGYAPRNCINENCFFAMFYALGVCAARTKTKTKTKTKTPRPRLRLRRKHQDQDQDQDQDQEQDNYSTVCAGICAPKLFQRKLSFCDVICAGAYALRDVGQAQLTTKTKIKAPRYAPQVESRWGLQAAWLIKSGYAQGMRRLMKPPPDPNLKSGPATAGFSSRRASGHRGS